MIWCQINQPMIRSLLEIISRQSARRTGIQRVSLTDPLRRFNDSNFTHVKAFKIIAKAIAQQTNMVVESVLSDDAIPDWKGAGDYASPERIADLSIFCSDCLVQFAIRDLKLESALVRLDAGLIADMFSLIRLMYGDFATGNATDELTFGESLESRDFRDILGILHLTILLDQLMNVPPEPNDSHRDAKIQKVQKLFQGHGRAFAYTLHSVL
jgi:hypothetical protein